MEWKLEPVVVPVSDVERAKHFYSEQIGFVVDHDTRISDTMRVVQLTPPSSACSIAVGSGIADAVLASRGVAVSAVQHYEGAQLVDGHGGALTSAAAG